MRIPVPEPEPGTQSCMYFPRKRRKTEPQLTSKVDAGGHYETVNLSGPGRGEAEEEEPGSGMS